MRLGFVDHLVRAATAAIVAAITLLPGAAAAVPALQLYIEGSTYNSTNESWEFTGDSFKLWVLGNVGQFGPILDVRLTVELAFPLSPANISIVPSTATPGLLPAPGDPSTPMVPTAVASPSSAFGSTGTCGNNGTIGTLPCLTDGTTTLPPHGEYGPGTHWVEFNLGDFTETDSPIGDFIDVFPTAFPKLGQINVYQVTVNENPALAYPAGTVLHFDAFDHYLAGKKAKYKFAPFSHDAIDAPAPSVSVPEPAAAGFLLVALGLWTGWLGVRRARRQA